MLEESDSGPYGGAGARGDDEMCIRDRVSAVLIGKLKTAFDFIKRHYKTINLISGIFLILMGILMMTGLLARLLSLLS